MKRFLGIILILMMLITIDACSHEKTKTVKIGVIDSCITQTTIEDFNISNIYNIVEKKNQNELTHGRIMLDIISQNASNYELFYCSALDENFVGEISDIIKAINWCVDNEVDIISMSFSTLNNTPELKAAIERAIKSNIIVVAACINRSDKICYPAMYEGVISVSEGYNTNASIIIKDKTFEVNIEGRKLERTGTSVLTAYVCGEISNEMSKGNKIEGIKENINFD